MELITLSQTKELLTKYNLSPLKQLGQNFLIDANITRNIAECICAKESTNIIEIGPGLGALTRVLAQKFRKVIAIELDSGMVKVLNDLFAESDNVTIIHADILKTDINKTAEKYFNNEPFHVCGNLPYYITAKCLLKICESNSKSMTAMVQKEVAERIVSEPGTKDYGVLSASIAYYTKPSTVFTVSKNCFYPAPDVESAVISASLGNPLLSADRNAYISTVKNSFAQRRKTIFNNLSSAYRQLTKEEIKRILQKADIRETDRAETISPEKFAELSELLS